MTEDFQEAAIFDKPALFTPIRIARTTIPHGYHLYEVRHDDDCGGDAIQIARNIAVNHWGSLITRDELELDCDGFLDIDPMDLNYSTGDCRSMWDFITRYPPNIHRLGNLVTIVDAPIVNLADDEKAGEALFSFYRALGWNGDDYLDPHKIRTTKAVFDSLYSVMYDRCPDPLGVGMLMCNRGPGTEDFIPQGKVYLYEGWITPVEPEEGENTDECRQQAV
jgi:hypothetical protein